MLLGIALMRATIGRNLARRIELKQTGEGGVRNTGKGMKSVVNLQPEPNERVSGAVWVKLDIAEGNSAVFDPNMKLGGAAQISERSVSFVADCLPSYFDVTVLVGERRKPRKVTIFSADNSAAGAQTAKAVAA